ncbi:unnamed protein product [Effrenium voratum]|uniref:Uncharacterized protein n=1 Tax=Effrenium voratum TaxID=2562239 RepID=A0AA36JCX0_9DINO|nr:unnamed protein product [Effrenium voratum]
MEAPEQLEELFGGLHDWRDVQGVMKTIFQALCDVAHAQSQAVREVERRTGEMQEELMAGLNRKADASELRDVRLASEEEVESILESQRAAAAEVQALRTNLAELKAATEKPALSVWDFRVREGFGWSDAPEYFQAMGDNQVMLVDVDHNDSDDRLAIILLAFQVASANAERRKLSADACSFLYLDARTYSSSGLTLWRTLQLATRLSMALAPYGVEVLPLLQGEHALEHIAKYLKVAETPESLNDLVPGAGDMLRLAQRKQDLQSCLPPRSTARVWMLSGLCQTQVQDLDRCHKELGIQFSFIEQAQPAWQSFPVKDGPQPDWSFPPADEAGFGVEPSNIRSSEATYPETLMNYLRFQQLVASWGARYVSPALARSDSFLPAVPGKPMLPVSGRPFNVIPGKTYTIKKALDPNRAQHAFAKLLSASKVKHENLLPELCIDSSDDFGSERPELAAVNKYGTFMADAILVALAAAPSLPCSKRLRRLALAVVPQPGNDDIVLTFEAGRLEDFQESLEEKANPTQLKEIVREAWGREEGHLARLQKLCDSKVSVTDFAALAAVAEAKASLADVDATVQRQVQRRLQSLMSDHQLVTRTDVTSLTEAWGESRCDLPKEFPAMSNPVRGNWKV